MLAKIAKIKKIDIDEIVMHYEHTVNALKNSELSVEVSRALRTACEYNISVYDAHFVLLAKDFDVPLVTEDKEVLKNCPDIAVNMQRFIAA